MKLSRIGIALVLMLWLRESLAQGQGSWGSGNGIVLLAIPVLLCLGVIAFCKVAARKPALALIPLVVGALCVLFFPSEACQGQAPGFRCPPSAKFFAWAIPFFGGFFASSILLWPFTDKRPSDGATREYDS